MPPQLKRTLPWADAHQDEYNEDFAPYTVSAPRFYSWSRRSYCVCVFVSSL